MQSIETELVQRNREIAQIRDLLRQREAEVENWKGRHGELVGRLADLNGELTKSRVRMRKLDKFGEDKMVDQCNASKLDTLQEDSESNEQCSVSGMDLNAADCESNLNMEIVEGNSEADRIGHMERENFEKQLLEERKRLEAACLEAQAAQDEVGALKTKLLEVGELKTRLLDMEAMQARFAADTETAAIALNQIADLEKQLETERRTHSAEVAVFEEQIIAERKARLEAEVKLDDADRIREESSEKLELVATLKAQIEASRAALLEAETMHINTAHERDTATALLEQVQRDYRNAEGMISVAVAMRDEATNEVAKLTGELSDLACERDEFAHKLEHATLELKKLRQKHMSNEHERAALEDRVSPAKLSRFEARVRTLQAENDMLRAETSGLRRRQKEMRESLAMATDEGRSTRAEMLQLEAVHKTQNARLRAQLEETRRARTLEMNTLVKKLCRSEEPHTSMSSDQLALQPLRHWRASSPNSLAQSKASNSWEAFELSDQFQSSPPRYGVVKEIHI